MFGQPWREYVASPIAEKDGVLYVSTNLGLVAAVDRRLGSVLWLAPYPQIPIQPTMNYRPQPRRLSWYSNPPIVHEGRLYVTPLDSDTMIAFDAASGRRLFEVKRNPRDSEDDVRRSPDRPDYRYMIGVRMVASVTQSNENEKLWSATLGLETEPVGALRYLLGIRSWY